jgi:hypothetical protein
MGMYDYFCGEQFKIFYVPLFYVPVFSGESKFGRMGGLMRSFTNQSDLPLSTMYYKYPESFIVIDVDFPKSDETYAESNFLEIKDKKISRVGWIEDHHQSIDFSLPIYDNRGNLINVKKFEDIEKMRKRRENIIERNFKLKDSVFPEDYFRMLKSNYDRLVNSDKFPVKFIRNIQTDYDRLVKIRKEEMIEKIREENWKKFSEEWIIDDGFNKERELGEMLYCFEKIYEEKDKETESIGQVFFDYKKIYEDFIEQMKEKRELLNPDLINSYLIWQELNSDEQKEKIRKMIGLLVDLL